MGFWQSIFGKMQVEIISADCNNLLTAISNVNIPVHKVKTTDALTISIEISYRDFKTLSKLVEKRAESMRIIRRNGVHWTRNKVVKRPVLLICLLLFSALILYLPSRIFFVRVVGNETVPNRLILAEAENCGVRFGAPRRQIRSEKVKNALIAKLPQLQWVGVNTIGCVATIQVREKSAAEPVKQTEAVSSIVAQRDGVIYEMTVFDGTPTCKVGQVVKKGQTLVSGYTDCGILIKATQAKAEIYAQTYHKLTFVVPNVHSVRGEMVGSKKKYSIKIGKKLINFYNGSGISDTSCVKMYEEKYLTLPGGFQLPIALICQKTILYDDCTTVSITENYDWLESLSKEYLQEQMLAGKVLYAEYDSLESDGVYCLKTQFSCIEMIGQNKSEESLQIHG